MYESYILPNLEYDDIMSSNMTEEQSLLIDNVINRTGEIIPGAIAGTSTSIIYDEMGCASMESRKKQRGNFTFNKIIHDRSPS